MKHIFLLLALLICHFVTSQEVNTDRQILEDVKVSLEMGSYEDLEVLDSDDFISLFEYVKTDQAIELEIICNFDHSMDDMTISGTTVRLKGNSNDLDEFTKKAERAKNALKQLYNTKG